MSNNKIFANLDLDSFWNDLYSKYPTAIAHFSDWVDDYKKQNNWEDLFPPILRKHYPINVKFHDLSVGLQIGVLIQYLNEDTALPAQFIESIKFDFIEKLKKIELPSIEEKLNCVDCENSKACASFGCEKQLGFHHKNPM